LNGFMVVWQDELGKALEEFLDPGLDPDLLDPDLTAGTACLRFVDPYGDTVFNQIQIPVLVAELESLSANQEGSLAESARLLAEFLRQKQDQVHTYIKIIGD
jgi:hypothetical protein